MGSVVFDFAQLRWAENKEGSCSVCYWVVSENLTEYFDSRAFYLILKF